MQDIFVGIDVSTTASKVLAIDDTGTVIASHTSPHSLSTPHPLWSEQNPSDWWNATRMGIKEILKKVSKDAIRSIGLTGQMHGLVILDAQEKILRPAIIWNDGRSHKECEEIEDLLGKEFLYGHIGSELLPCFIAPKLIWVKKNEPEVFRRIAHILLPKDYIGFCLSGHYATDVGDGSGLGLMDIAKRTWSPSILSALDIPNQWLPSLYESHEVFGTISASTSRELGLNEGTPIIAGTGDQPAGGIGSAVTESHRVSVAVGTSGVTFAVSDQYRPDRKGRLNTFCHAMPGKWFHMGVSMSAAGSLRWVRDSLIKDQPYSSLDALARIVPRGSKGLLFAPYLSGERHPYSDPHARGAFVGLTTRHDLSCIIRSVLEGVAFSIKDNLELMGSLGIRPNSIVLSGGAAKSSLWRSIIGEVLGLPIHILQTNEGASLGAAILGAVGVNAWANCQSACKALIQKQTIESPDIEGIKAYSAFYPLYQKLYPSLTDLNRKLAMSEL